MGDNIFIAVKKSAWFSELLVNSSFAGGPRESLSSVRP